MSRRAAPLRCALALAALALLPAAGADDPPPVDDDDGVHTVLCFSGGGTRAAAFAHGAALGLAEVDAGGRTLLERVDRIVGVSGGSLTAAQVAIDRRPDALARFEREVLRDDMELAMVRAAASSGYSLLASDLTRGDVAAGCFQARLGATTFADLPARPELWIQTTDVLGERPLVLSREALAHLGLDPAGFPLSRAVAASAAFPGVFPPLRVLAPGHHPRECPGSTPTACVAAIGTGSAPLFLADGGILDNLGLEPALEAGAPPGARAIVVIVVDARRGLLADERTMASSVRAGLHALELQQHRLDALVLGRARDRLRLLELEAAIAGRTLTTELVVVDFAASARREALDAVGTRFALDDDEVTLLIDEGRAVARARCARLAEAW